MSQGRWIDGRLVNEVFVVNQTSGGGGGGGVTESEVSGIVSGLLRQALVLTLFLHKVELMILALLQCHLKMATLQVGRYI